MTTSFTFRLPENLHKAARLKSVRTEQSLNSILVAKLQEWVDENETKPTPTPRKKSAAVKTAAAQ